MAKVKKYGIIQKLIDHPRYKYKVEEEFRFELDHDYGEQVVWRQRRDTEKLDAPLFKFNGHELRVFAGYMWDGSSGPTIDSDSDVVASLMHDCSYQALRMKRLPWKYRKYADIDFYRLLRTGGLMWIRAAIRYMGLRLFGGYAARG